MKQYHIKQLPGKEEGNTQELIIKQKIDKLFKQLNNIYGPEGLILKASKLEAVDLLDSNSYKDRVLGLQRIIQHNPTINRIPEGDDLQEIIKQLEDKVVEISVKRKVEDDLQHMMQEKMEQKYNEYVQDVKVQVLKEVNKNLENAQTLKKLGQLEKMEYNGLNTSAFEVLRPGKITEIVGQERALNSLVSKLNTPYPQHILFYGPPGVGKTTCARLAMEMVKGQGSNVFKKDAPFIEVDGTTLRWDPRESTNPLLGSVHDPIYQGAKKELADEGIPEPKLGLVSKAHGGILFIDEIGEMDVYLQNKLLKVMEDKRVYFDSSYYDPNDERFPNYIKKIFEEGVPADFILIGATTRDKEEISPAFRSRCMEIYFDPLTKEQILDIIHNSAGKLDIELGKGVSEIICDYCNDGRSANKLLIDAYDLAYNENNAWTGRVKILSNHIYEAIQNSRLKPYILRKASQSSEVGKVYGVGVHAYQGSLIEFEGVAFSADKEKEGTIRFNDTAGSMTRDSLINAASVFRQENGENLSNYDVHINIIGGGKVDGPSAGAAIYLAITSAVYDVPVLQNVAVSGEISIKGKIRPVGGIYQKICGAKQAGIKKIIIPYENIPDIPAGINDIEIIAVQDIAETYKHIFAENGDKKIKLN